MWTDGETDRQTHMATRKVAFEILGTLVKVRGVRILVNLVRLVTYITAILLAF